MATYCRRSRCLRAAAIDRERRFDVRMRRRDSRTAAHANYALCIQGIGHRMEAPPNGYHNVTDLMYKAQQRAGTRPRSPAIGANADD